MHPRTDKFLLKELFDSSLSEEPTHYTAKTDFSCEKIFKEEALTLYSPKLVRGTGKLREGYCNFCDRWFKMKTSSYWYHMNYKHGINSRGEKFPEPEIKNEDKKISGFCKICSEWINLGTKMKRSRFLWRKHCQKTHSV